MKISIFGLGYVGTVSAACLSQYHELIVGVDSNDLKVASIGKGESPIVEPGVSQLLKEAVAQGKLKAITDPTEAILTTDISLICVGTPSHSNGSLNLDYVFTVAEQIGKALKFKGYHAVAIRSTVLPGTVDKVASIIMQSSGKVLGQDFGVASNPEFLREGTAVLDFENPPYTIIGASDQRIESILRNIYKNIKAPVFALDVRAAELLKYACNAFHAVKVTFGNEIGAICKRFGIDSHAVMDVFAQDTKLNISPNYLKPGFAFGGSCLPKDVRAITHQSRAMDISVPLLESLLRSNDVHIQRAIDWIIGMKKKNIGVLGLSFKSDTDDMRESPIVEVIETLLGKGYSICVYDANVNLSRLIGANKRFIEQEIPHISSLMKGSIQEVIDASEIILVANRAPEFLNALKAIRPDQHVLDLVRITEDQKDFRGRYEGICW